MEGGGGIGLFRSGFFLFLFLSISCFQSSFFFRSQFVLLFFVLDNSVLGVFCVFVVHFLLLLAVFFYVFFFCVFWKTGSPEAHEGKALEGRHTGERRVLLSTYQASFLVGVFFCVEFSRLRYVDVQVHVASLC